MSIGSPLDAVLIETQQVFVAAELCKCVRYRKSSCQNCVDVCPDDAITLSPGPGISDSCTNCGLCRNVCPTEVFQLEVDMDQAVLQQVHSLPGKESVPGNGESVFIHCDQAEKQHEDSLAIQCLGNLSENFFLGAALSGLDEINLAIGHCARCHLKNGERLLTDSMTTARAIVKNMHLEKFAVTLLKQQKTNNSAPRLTRREFFSKISPLETADTSSTVPARTAEEIRSGCLVIQDGKRLSPRREMLHRLIKQNETAIASVNDKQQALPWRKMKVDEANCVACGICVNVCPTGALTRIFENDQVVRHLNNSACTNCFLCQEACPENVISFDEDYTFTDLIEDRAYVVARIDMKSCAVCGEIIPVGSNEMCTTCEKRQTSPMFM